MLIYLKMFHVKQEIYILIYRTKNARKNLNYYSKTPKSQINLFITNKELEKWLFNRGKRIRIGDNLIKNCLKIKILAKTISFKMPYCLILGFLFLCSFRLVYCHFIPFYPSRVIYTLFSLIFAYLVSIFYTL